MKKTHIGMMGAMVVTAGLPSLAMANECSTVRFAEVGWTDITATTALASEVLEGMGYEARVDTVSVPIAYSGMENGDFDVFLGNWMPSMASISDPYVEKGTVDRLTANLEGAKYTLAVPQYVYDAGVTSVEDLAEHADQFDQQLHGIEAGNDGNELIQQMIDDDAFGLGDWQLVDSSEAGMLAELTARVPNEDWMVFLGWEPHPMNTNFDMAYLEGADDYFGPDLGGATVYTNTRGGYAEECPNVGELLNNMTFTLEMENQLMGEIMDDGEDPRDAARAYLQENDELLGEWLAGVETIDGEPAEEAVRNALQ
ncbi:MULTISPECIES: choline ABC transporter substrate-binding protein [Halomonadaceae]|jgi:glycine betaine/proline transport system substrate-binding protein|uniref:Choline ABC transporter substrate-binding protein n=1 Tax=Vreelandella janggokensis TaxID=370767 RepID=A0ABT4IUF7_9GAMM|nr:MULTISPECIES: choline ABC transporter substrate-binding protein [Halomonas]MCW4148127.1 choline ABC transporter substrate-binding protein [Halomonas sp. 18H]MCZ0926644.1 choline ABC transporter substrate-binding protein [Halomonas janggokensis]MCZ0929182.1 choline ABC transporter substrate-binding protein [Halomonas janggokensis]MDR5885404.1 choline ABC transporter substrate-binding protein [Halomonas janggokensis]QPL44556.1 choline ABC transporter substrate-binding protein [Halomonas sp. A